MIGVLPSAMRIVVGLCILVFSLHPHLAAAGNEKTVALVMKALSNPFFSKMEAGARRYAKDHEIQLEVFGLERETDVGRQISIVESLISREYGAIIISPADSKKLVPICKKAQDRGIVVVNIDNPFHKPTMQKLNVAIPFIGSDNYVGARMVGEYIKRKLGVRGRVLIIEGMRGAVNSDLRKQGFLNGIKAGSSIEIVASESANWHTDEALSLTMEMLHGDRSIDAIFCSNDAMALGALQALDLLGFSQGMILAGYDNIQSVRTEIRNGRIQATVEQHPELMGSYGVASAWKGLNGDDIPAYQATPLDLVTYEHFNKRIAFSISTLQNPFFSMLVESTKQAADLFGMKLIVMDANNQEAQQLTDIANALSQPVDMLILNPTNTESISSGIEYANNRHIPVITVDRKASAGQVLCHIESNNAQGGRMAGKIMAEQLNGKGIVFELEGIPGTSAALERGDGFNGEIGKFDQITISHREVANFDRQLAKIATQRLLDNKVRFDGVFAHNDNMILGAISAFEASGVPLPEVLIGFDAIPEARKYVKQKKLTATIAQQPGTMGKLAIETAACYFRGEEISPVKLVELSLVKN